MAIRNILNIKEDNESLRKTSKTVVDFSGIGELLDDMKETMQNAKGCGLAAPQVGILKRVIVVEVDEKYFEMINPVITFEAGDNICKEGCLSVDAKRYDFVKRPQEITVEAFDRNGKKFEVKASGYLARAFCHEIDHLNGVLYIDKIVKE